MITASEYTKQNKKLIEKYEETAREWVRKNGTKDLAEKIPYFIDGVVDPQIWFEDGNEFRPLFILKEVSIGKNSAAELDDYLKKWGNKTKFDFVGYDFDDIRIGTFATWKRIARLALGLEYAWNNHVKQDYYAFDSQIEYIKGEEYFGDIKGYTEEFEQIGKRRIRTYKYRTGNKKYDEIMHKIAVIDIKKIGGGTYAVSEISLATGFYGLHADPNADLGKLLRRQIELINPTVVICCGNEGGNISDRFLSDIKNKDCLWINGRHPVLSKNEDFYDKVIEEYLKYIKNK